MTMLARGAVPNGAQLRFDCGVSHPLGAVVPNRPPLLVAWLALTAALCASVLGCLLVLLLRLAPPSAAELVGTSFNEETYSISAEPGFVKRCFLGWQAECRAAYGHDEELQHRLCETHLDRNYVKIHVLVPQVDILRHWAYLKPLHDLNRGWYSHGAPQFTSLGFQKARMPPHLHEATLDWYRKNRHLAAPEGGEPAFGMHCNTGHDNDDWLVPYRRELPEVKVTWDQIEAFLKPLLSNWTGLDVNECTVTYGVRQYHRGSICGMHVDAPQTHAFGVVYQLDQVRMDEPWPFDYVTHDGEEHRTTLEPGELIFYEAASSLHGRKDPMRGDEYANLFFHFRAPNWVPSLQKAVDAKYTPAATQMDEAFSAATGRSLWDRPGTQHREWGAADPCLPLRSRERSLLAAGRMTELPHPEAYTLESFADGLLRNVTELELAGAIKEAEAVWQEVQSRRQDQRAQQHESGQLALLATAVAAVLCLLGAYSRLRPHLVRRLCKEGGGNEHFA